MAGWPTFDGMAYGAPPGRAVDALFVAPGRKAELRLALAFAFGLRLDWAGLGLFAGAGIEGGCGCVPF